MANEHKYNLFTTQKGRTPLWTPDEIESILDGLERGDLTVLENDKERIALYVNDRHDQLVKLGVTEMELSAMFAGALGKIDLEFRDFRGYLRHVKMNMANGWPYVMPADWRDGVESVI